MLEAVSTLTMDSKSVYKRAPERSKIAVKRWNDFIFERWLALTPLTVSSALAEMVRRGGREVWRTMVEIHACGVWFD